MSINLTKEKYYINTQEVAILVKYKRNILSSLISNFETVEEVIQTSVDSNGSAMLENSKYLDSIQGKLDQFSNSLQTFWAHALNSDVIKWFVDMGTEVIQLVDNIGLIPSALAGVLLYFTAIKKNNPMTMLQDFGANMHNYGMALNQVKMLHSSFGTDTSNYNDDQIKAFGLAVEGLTQKQQVAALAAQNLSKEQIAQAIGVKDLTDANFQAALAEAQVTTKRKEAAAVTGQLMLANQKNTNIQLSSKATAWLEANSREVITKKVIAQAVAKGKLTHQDAILLTKSLGITQQNVKQAASWKGLTSSIGNLIKQNPVAFFSAVGTAIAGLIGKIETVVEETKRLTEEYTDFQNTLNQLEGNLNSVDVELGSIQDQIDQLQSQDTLSIADAKQLSLLRDQSAELQRQKEIYETFLSARDHQNQVKSLQMINTMLKTTAANQEEAAASGKEWGKWIGTGALAIAAGLATWWAGGSGALIVGAGSLGAIVGGAAGSKIGESVGSASKATDGSLIEWYESYENALLEAEQAAANAERAYLADLTQDNYDAWQKKTEEVIKLQDAMYGGLEELQNYISNLEYNDQTAYIFDNYNKLIAHLDVRNKSGDIDAQVESIQSLSDEYEKLAVGVDINGKNIALSADEYARYQAIIQQIIGYVPSLINGYDMEGNAIISRNNLIEESIRLLREQQQAAAKSAISSESITTAINNTQTNQKNQMEAVKISNYGRSTEEMLQFGTVLEEITGVKRPNAQLIDTFMQNNIEEINQHHNAALDKMRDYYTRIYPQYTKAQIDELVETWHTLLLDAYDAYTNIDMSQIHDVLLSTPIASDGYFDLSGDAQNFLDLYVRTHFDGLDPDSEEDISNTVQHISDITNRIIQDETAQNLINSIFSMDKKNMPIGEYKKNISDILNQLTKQGILTVDEQSELFEQLIPNNDEINKMLKSVREKLQYGYKYFASDLTEAELQIAYKYTLTESADSMSPEDIKKFIAQQKAEDFSISNYSDDITAISEELSTLQSALDKLDSGTFTITDFAELIKQFPDLAKGVDVSSKKFSGLSKNLKKAMRTSPEKLIDELEDLRDELKAAGESTTDIDQLITSMKNLPTDVVKELSEEYITLADAIDEAKIAQNEIQEAMQEDPNSGYQTRDDANTYMQEAMQRGEIGSESNLWNVAKETYGFERSEDESLEAAADRLAKWVALRDKWFKEDDDGNNTFAGAAAFAQDIEEAVQENTRLQELLQWNYNEATGGLSFDFDNTNWNEIVKLLGETENAAGLTSAEFRDMLVWLGQFYDINWEDSDDLLLYLQEVGSEADTAVEKYAAVEDAVANYLRAAELDPDVMELEVDSQEFRNLPAEVREILTEYHKIKKQYEDDPLQINYQLQQDRETNLTDGPTKETIDALSQLTSVIQDNDTGVIALDLENLRKQAQETGMDITTLNDEITKLQSAGKLIDIKITESDPLGLESLAGSTQTAMLYLESLGVSINTLSDQSLTIDVPSFVKLLVAQGWTEEQIRTYMQNLNKNGYTFTYTVEGQSEPVELLLNTTPGQNRLHEFVSEKEAAFEADEVLTVNLAGTAEEAIKSMKTYLDSMTDKKYDVTINRHINEYSTKYKRNAKTGEYEYASVNGTAHAQGTAYAGGSWGAKETGTALVGELGQELIVRGDKYFTVGDNGAEFTDIKKGDIRK